MFLRIKDMDDECFFDLDSLQSMDTDNYDEKNNLWKIYLRFEFQISILIFNSKEERDYIFNQIIKQYDDVKEIKYSEKEKTCDNCGQKMRRWVFMADL